MPSAHGVVDRLRDELRVERVWEDVREGRRRRLSLVSGIAELTRGIVVVVVLLSAEALLWLLLLLLVVMLEDGLGWMELVCGVRLRSAAPAAQGGRRR